MNVRSFLLDFWADMMPPEKPTPHYTRTTKPISWRKAADRRSSSEQRDTWGLRMTLSFQRTHGYPEVQEDLRLLPNAGNPLPCTTMRLKQRTESSVVVVEFYFLILVGVRSESGDGNKEAIPHPQLMKWTRFVLDEDNRVSVSRKTEDTPRGPERSGEADPGFEGEQGNGLKSNHLGLKMLGR